MLVKWLSSLWTAPRRECKKTKFKTDVKTPSSVNPQQVTDLGSGNFKINNRATTRGCQTRSLVVALVCYRS
eukprot:m.151446 g.151446  ORF g.151446 m.151446 type:complete len:71 (+) comp17409_c0_seq8:207-419(+)